MEPHEERILGHCGCSVAFNSAIAARRGLSPRIADLEGYGCTIGMGSDNMSEDMVEVVRTGLFMERVRREDGRQPTPEEALRWGTANGYQALGWTEGGSLETGKGRSHRHQHGEGAPHAAASRRLLLRASRAAVRH
jgi:5-methylthioadenosine/S-adenosylhomocysteine deaminase